VLTDPNDPNSAPPLDQGMLANVAAGAAGHAGTLAGWALSSLGKKVCHVVECWMTIVENGNSS
jgi:hypothetical protein